jgi:hypothetical protein
MLARVSPPRSERSASNADAEVRLVGRLASKPERAPRVAVVLLVAFWLGIPVSSASAGTATLAVGERDGVQAAWVVYRADPRERNNMYVGPDWSEDGSTIDPQEPSPPRPPTALVVDDGVHEQPGAGCERGPAGNSELVRCPIPPGARVVGPRVYLGDLLDKVEIGGRLDWRNTEVFGGPGNDTISG